MAMNKVSPKTSMNKDEREALIAIPIALLLAYAIGWAGSQGSVEVNDLPLFGICFALAFVIQWIAFIPAYLKQTEVFYDLTGSLTYLSVTLIALYYSPIRDSRSILLAVLIAIWALRLGSFLFLRIKSAGEDRRFREIKPSFIRFLMAWTIQGLWVSLSICAALAAITSQELVPFDKVALLGLMIWLVGFSIEVIADRQKSQFRQKSENQGRFINEGLWSWSRHPNYFGEIILWIGIMVIAMPVLTSWQWVTLISPIFITVLLTKVSGIPMLEERADKKWGSQQDYETYKASTSILILRPPTKNEN